MDNEAILGPSLLQYKNQMRINIALKHLWGFQGKDKEDSIRPESKSAGA